MSLQQNLDNFPGSQDKSPPTVISTSPAKSWINRDKGVPIQIPNGIKCLQTCPGMSNLDKSG